MKSLIIAVVSAIGFCCCLLIADRVLSVRHSSANWCAVACRDPDNCPFQATLTERVELIHFRTRLRHAGCASNGFMESAGQPTAIDGELFDGRTRYLWPHKCDRCGATNTLFDVRYPQIKGEWRAVK